MKRELAVLLTVLILLSGLRPALAQPEGQQVLILLPLPDPGAYPPETSPRDYTEVVATPLLQELARLQHQGWVSAFALQPDRHAIQVTLAGEAGAQQLARGIPSATALPATPDNVACAGRAAAAMREVLQSPSALAQPRNGRPQATNPTVSVYYTASGYSSVSGYTDSNVGVTVVFRDSSGQVKATRSVISDGNGYYSVWSAWKSCAGYEYLVYAGDWVEVTAAGNTVRVDIVAISATLDPTNDTVSGTTAPDQVIRLAGRNSSVGCSGTWLETLVTSDSGGHFSAYFPDGFDRTAYMGVYVYDDNDNTCSTSSFYAPRIALDYDGYVSGYLPPNTAGTIRLRRGGGVVEQQTVQVGATGSFSTYLLETVLAGDVVEASAGGVTVSLTAIELNNLTLDPDTDRISGSMGSGGAGRRVKIYPYHTEDCSGEGGACLAGTADSSGSFVLDYGVVGYDLRRGDRDYSAGAYDAEGNLQYFWGRLTVPIVQATINSPDARGYWGERGAALTIVLRDNGGTVKEVDTDTSSDYSGQFYAWFSSPIAAGDSLEVGDGTYSMTLNIPDLSAWLDVNTNHVNGRAPEGSTLDLILNGYYPAGNYACVETTAAAGNVYDVDLGLDVQAFDYLSAYYTAPDGHQALATSDALGIETTVGESTVSGVAPAPNSTVTVTLVRGAALETLDLTTDSYGYYWGYFSYTTQEADVIQATPAGGTMASLTIPPLSVNGDAVNNRIYGQAPANSPLEVELRRVDWSTMFWSELQSDGAGAYEVSLTGEFDYSCQPVVVGEGCTYPVVGYYDAGANRVWKEGPLPPSENADAYEPDDTFAEATPYQGVQAHSFHVSDDPDWISFSVPAYAVGRPYILQTKDLGIRADTYLSLFDTDGTTLIAGDDDSGPGLASLLIWSPATAGTYYVQVDPYGTGNPADCGETYKLEIRQLFAFLPVAFKGYSFYFAGPWEAEPNNSASQANGPVRPGQSYYGHVNDTEDYFTAQCGPGTVTVDLTNYNSASGQLLFYRHLADPNPIQDFTAPYQIVYNAPTWGTYYIRIYSVDLRPAEVYTLRVTCSGQR